MKERKEVLSLQSTGVTGAKREDGMKEQKRRQGYRGREECLNPRIRRVVMRAADEIKKSKEV